MANKNSVVMCIVVVVVALVATMKLREVEAADGFDACHGNCTDYCVVDGNDKAFCSLKCDNFCSDHVRVSAGNDQSDKDTDHNDHIVADVLGIPIPAVLEEEAEELRE
ncbi:hypothetical protein BVC80_8787g3 [Macleaya cordata]|uniref:Pollen allergen ole e 6 n=1 Tax=Macleaya cordata TaxID=56857 RepID=A0A200PVA4_MACCD|nr:hypothetical protein BVC80_8787g3 [Macleaya cordata]